MSRVTFRAKIETPQYVDGTFAPSRIKVPKLTAAHYDKSEFRNHPDYRAYANSDLFPSLLNRALQRSGVGAYVMLDSLPSSVTVDTTGFLALVTIELGIWK